MIMNEIGLSLDTVWMLLAAMLVFWMQPDYERNWIITRYCMDAIGSHVGFLDAAGLCAV